MADTIFTTGPSEKLFPNKPGDGIADDQPEQFTPFDQYLPSRVLDVADKTREMTKSGPGLTTFQEYLKSEESNIAQSETDGRMQIQDRVFEQGLSGEVDLNSLFDQPVIEDQNVYTMLKEAKKAETAGNASPDQVAMLNDARTGNVRQDFDYLLPNNSDLYYGVQETGQFPIDMTTGKVMTPPNVPEGGQLEAKIQEKAEDAAYLKQWMESRPDAPTNPKIRSALLKSIEADLGDVFAERLYSLANATKEGVGFYLPYYAGYAYDSIMNNDTSEYTDEGRQKELVEFRDNFPAFADRQTVMNDILREQLRLQLGDQEFDRLGLGKKTTVDGVEQYEVNFVGEQFANDMFEELFNMQSVPGKLATLIGENVAAYNVFKAPFTFLGSTYRAVQRNIKAASGQDVPFKFLSTSDQAVAVATAAQTRNVPIANAAIQLADEAKYAGFLTKWRQGSLAQVVAGRAGASELALKQTARHEKIVNMQHNLIRAEKVGNDVKAASITQKLNRELALQNWASVKQLAPYAREYGFSPVFDTTMAISQLIGRNMSPENPQMGELFGVGAMIGTYATGKLFRLDRVPFVGSFMSGASFRAKVATESFVGAAFTLLGAANRGRGEGWLVNPNLKAIVDMPAEARKNLTTAELRAFDVFTKGLISASGRESLAAGGTDFTDAILKNISQTVEDMDTVVMTLPAAMRDEARAALKMSLGQASQMNFFFSMAAALDASTVATKPKAFIKVQKQVREKLQIQIEADKQIAAMGLAADRMDRIILRLNESGDPAQIEAANRLEVLSSSFKSAYAEGNRQQKLLSGRNLEQAQRLIEDLASPNLSIGARKQAILSDQVDDLIEMIGATEARFTAEVDKFSGTTSRTGITDASMDTASTQAAAVKVAAITANQAVGKLTDAVIQGTESSRLPTNAAELMAGASDQIMQVTKLARSDARIVVNAEYDKVSTTTPIEFTPVATNLLEIFSAYRLNASDSIAKSANPLAVKSLGGTAGVRMMNGMNNAATRGMKKLFSNESVLKALGDDVGMDFNSADDVISYFKNDYYGTNSTVLAELGVESGDQISNLQLALKIIGDKELVMDARNLSFIASPKEMEDLRQAANQLRKSNNEDKSNLGRVVITTIDDTLEKWGNTLNVEDYNQVARARVLSRLEAQRFDQGTIGNDIERITAGDIQVIAGEGGTTQLTKGGRQVVDLLKPLIDNIVNPGPNSTAIVKSQLDRLSTTFASLSPSLADNILVMGADGKFRIPTGDELSEVTFKVMDLEGFKKLQAIIGTSVKNEFLKISGMEKVQQVVRASAGSIVVETPMILNAADMPKAIKVPEQFEGDLAAYLESIEDAFTFMVKDGDNPPVAMKLFDTDDLLTADRDVVTIVNLSKEYQQTHADLLSVAKTAQSEMGTTEAAIADLALESLSQVHKSSKTTVGREFFDKVIMSGDANEVTAYLTRTQAAIGADNMANTSQALFTEVIKSAGDFSRGRRTVKMFDGQEVPVDSYNRPDIVFALIDDAIEGTSREGKNIRALADAAGVSESQLKTLRAIFRLATKTEAPRLVREAEGNLQQSTKGFTLDNTLSKAFNLARGMVSKEYVAAEVALRYAAMGKGRMVSMILKDKRSAEIIYNVLKDETRVVEDDALYLAQSIMKFVAGDLSRSGVNFDTPVADREYIENYWKSQGIIFDFEEPQ